MADAGIRARSHRVVWTTDEECCLTGGGSASEEVARMPCGHCFTSAAMRSILNSVLEHKQETEIMCPAVEEDEDGIPCGTCNTTWDWGLVNEVAKLTKSVRKAKGLKMNDNTILQDASLSRCPGCEVFVNKPGHLSNDVQCVQCGKRYCWMCSKDWTPSHRCPVSGEDILKDIELAGTVKDKNFMGVKVAEIAAYRACVNCNALMYHTQDCKHVRCLQCGTRFCYICLKPRKDNDWQCGSYNFKCEVQPPQSSLM